MRTETITKYIAFDGTEFKDKKECEKYEQDEQIFDATFYNDYGEIITNPIEKKHTIFGFKFHNLAKGDSVIVKKYFKNVLLIDIDYLFLLESDTLYFFDKYNNQYTTYENAQTVIDTILDSYTSITDAMKKRKEVY